jgi:hypothetical protein
LSFLLLYSLLSCHLLLAFLLASLLLNYDHTAQQRAAHVS